MRFEQVHTALFRTDTKSDLEILWRTIEMKKKKAVWVLPFLCILWNWCRRPLVWLSSPCTSRSRPRTDGFSVPWCACCRFRWLWPASLGPPSTCSPACPCYGWRWSSPTRRSPGSSGSATWTSCLVKAIKKSWYECYGRVPRARRRVCWTLSWRLTGDGVTVFYLTVLQRDRHEFADSLMVLSGVQYHAIGQRRRIDFQRYGQTENTSKRVSLNRLRRKTQ